jgi:hypothetical protein
LMTLVWRLLLLKAKTKTKQGHVAQN